MLPPLAMLFEKLRPRNGSSIFTLQCLLHKLNISVYIFSSCHRHLNGRSLIISNILYYMCRGTAKQTKILPTPSLHSTTFFSWNLGSSTLSYLPLPLKEKRGKKEEQRVQEQKEWRSEERAWAKILDVLQFPYDCMHYLCKEYRSVLVRSMHPRLIESHITPYAAVYMHNSIVKQNETARNKVFLY